MQLFFFDLSIMIMICRMVVKRLFSGTRVRLIVWVGTNGRSTANPLVSHALSVVQMDTFVLNYIIG